MPDPSELRARRWRRRRTNRLVVVGVTVAIVAAGGVGIGYAATRPSAPNYRTASVAMGSVSQTVPGVGTVSSAQVRAVSFPISGTVKAVNVAVGQAVKAGATLATLDTTNLDAAVTSASTALTDAEQQLSADQSAETAAAAGSASAATSTVVSTPTAPTSAGGAGSASASSESGAGTVPTGSAASNAASSAAKAQVQHDQQGVTACQQLVDYLLGKTVLSAKRLSALACPEPTSGVAASGTTPPRTTAPRITVPRTTASGTVAPNARSGGNSHGGGAQSTDTPHSGTPVAAASGTTPTGRQPSSSAAAVPAPISAACVAVTAPNTSSGAPTPPVAPASPESATSSTTAPWPEAPASPATTTSAEIPAPPETSTVTETEMQTVTVTAAPDVPAMELTTTGRAARTASPVDGQASSTVTDCTDAIGSAEDALNAMYGWELQLDSGLGSLTNSTSSASTNRISNAANSAHDTTTNNSTNADNTSNNTVNDNSGAPTSRNGQSSTNSVVGHVPTAADIAADQAVIDTSEANIAVAKHNLATAVLPSPIAGTVAQVEMSAGDSIDASSSTETISVIGKGSYVVTTSMSLPVIDLIKVGQSVTVNVDGLPTALRGTVSQIGILNDSTTSTPSYPVTIALASTAQKLFDGAGASLSIAAGAATDVLTVPTSAVHTNGTASTVTVWDGTSTKTVPVKTGWVGSDLTQVTSGLTLGQVVVLADVGAALPTSQSGPILVRGVGVVGGGGSGNGIGAGLGGSGAGASGAGRFARGGAGG